jgi:hypothetical protein
MDDHLRLERLSGRLQEGHPATCGQQRPITTQKRVPLSSCSRVAVGSCERAVFKEHSARRHALLIRFAKNSPIRFTAAGFVAAVISVNFPNYLILGAIFGVAIVLYLALFEGIRTPFRFAAFLFACTVSFPLSILGTIVFGIRTPQSTDISLYDLFVGAKTRRSRVHAKIPDSCQSSKVGSGRRLHRPCLHEQAALH